MGPKGDPDTKTNWSTDCRPQDEHQLQLAGSIENIFTFTTPYIIHASQGLNFTRFLGVARFKRFFAVHTL
jgi:hypothetical protein